MLQRTVKYLVLYCIDFIDEYCQANKDDKLLLPKEFVEDKEEARSIDTKDCTEKATKLTDQTKWMNSNRWVFKHIENELNYKIWLFET